METTTMDIAVVIVVDEMIRTTRTQIRATPAVKQKRMSLSQKFQCKIIHIKGETMGNSVIIWCCLWGRGRGEEDGDGEGGRRRGDMRPYINQARFIQLHT